MSAQATNFEVLGILEWTYTGSQVPHYLPKVPSE